MFFYRVALQVFTLMLGLVSVQSFAQEQTEPDPVVAPSYAKGAELFGIGFNDLSKSSFEAHLKKMGLEPYPSYRAGIASYSLGKEGILGIRELTVRYNTSNFVEKATMSGVVESKEKRASLGNVLVKKYGQPDVGFVRDGFGRARWLMSDGTEIELHNTTFDVSVLYVDTRPAREQASGQIDVEALMRRAR